MTCKCDTCKNSEIISYQEYAGASYQKEQLCPHEGGRDCPQYEFCPGEVA